ncbi:MAG: hypothetical protein GYB31_12305 [Bacteroidetes bacterium]|nr:hypothetical protein [Bacteroidota bacterium]
MNSVFPEFQIFATGDAKQPSKQAKPAAGKRILLVSDTEIAPHREMVGKMIGAIQFDLVSDVQTIEITTEEAFSLMRLCRGSDIKEIILFGIDPEKLGLHLEWPLFRPLLLSGYKILQAESLNKISNNKDNKLKLWNALQQMFPAQTK